ncbi:MAG: MAE_28990/MAE_18760 family HEPN-like nuclease [Candidatus Bipolaricaulota bacterium]
MARYTRAYSSFASRSAEVDLLRKLAARKERVDPIARRHEINALCRGSLVLLCGHLEAFIKDLGEVALDSLHRKTVSREKLPVRFYYHISKGIVDEIRDTNDPDKVAKKVFALLEDDLCFWAQSGPFPCPIPADRFNRGFGNPAHDAIKTYFARFGYSEYQRDLDRQLKSRLPVVTNAVDHLVDVRNKIAHGDPNETKTPGEVGELTCLIRQYCIAADGVFASWFGRTLCSIR